MCARASSDRRSFESDHPSPCVFLLTMGLTDEQVVDMQMWWEKANEGALAEARER